MTDDKGVDLEFHAGECSLWAGEDCDCFLDYEGSYMLAAELDERDAPLQATLDEAGDLNGEDVVEITHLYEDWETDNPPRRSKNERPRHTTDNKGIFIVARKMASRFLRKEKK